MRSKIDFVILDGQDGIEAEGTAAGKDIMLVFNIAEMIPERLANIDQDQFVDRLKRDLDRIGHCETGWHV